MGVALKLVSLSSSVPCDEQQQTERIREAHRDSAEPNEAKYLRLRDVRCLPESFWAADGPSRVCGAIVEVDEDTDRTFHISRVNQTVSSKQGNTDF
jgi:calcineurin-like phosphoesterase